MARNAARLKMGYYPLPVSEAVRLRALLNFTGPASVVDPCVGQGTALEIITQDAEVRRYGVELDAERALIAQSKGIETIQGNAFDAIAKPESFSLLYLNPPYDSEIGLVANNRMERLFLDHTYRWLAMDGVLAMVIPFEQLMDWPTPRSWEMASHVLCGVARRQNTAFLTGAGEFEAQLLDGTVGQAASAELLAFLRLFRQLPSIDEILLNPESAPLPTEPSAQIAISTALGRVMSDSSIARGLKYLDRMPAEMRVMAMRDAAARDRAITHTPDFIRFGIEHQEVVQ